MKAAVLHEYGSVESFKIKDIPSPKIKKGQILIRNYASSVNPVDTLVRQGKLRIVSGLLGDKVTGSDFSGTVLDTKSERFKKGDEVFGFLNALKGEAYAEEVSVDEDNAFFKPTNVSFVEAAVLPLVGLTALQGLVNHGEIEGGDDVLILGCTGGVGSAAVQIAKAFHTKVTGTCSAKHMEFARAIGCDSVIDYKSGEVPKGKKFDLIFDATGLYQVKAFKENLTKEALFVSTRGGATDIWSGIEAAVDIFLTRKMEVVVAKPKSNNLRQLKELIEREKVKPVVAKTFPLAKIGAAHKMLEEESFAGKIAIDIH